MLEEKHFSNQVIGPAVCFILVLKLLDTDSPLTLASQIAGLQACAIHCSIPVLLGLNDN